MTEPSEHASPPQAGSDGRPARPPSVSTAVVLGFVAAGLSVLATLAMLLLVSALASAMEVDMGELVWTVGAVQLVVAALLLFGSLQLRWGDSRALYVAAAVLYLLNCVGWLVLVAGSGNVAFPLVPLLYGTSIVIGLVNASKQTSSDYLRAMRGR